MNSHFNTPEFTRKPTPPKHSKGWTPSDQRYDRSCGDLLSLPYFPGRHAKPFGKHHPATPVTYDAAGTTTPLVTAAPVLDVVA